MHHIQIQIDVSLGFVHNFDRWSSQCDAHELICCKLQIAICNLRLASTCALWTQIKENNWVQQKRNLMDINPICVYICQVVNFQVNSTINRHSEH